MTRLLPRSLSDVRRLLVALLAIALVLRLGGGCEAMAATPAGPAAHASHCTDMSARHGRHAKAESCACVACPALADPARALTGDGPHVSIVPVATPLAGMTGLAGGPAPPPPRFV